MVTEDEGRLPVPPRWSSSVLSFSLSLSSSLGKYQGCMPAFLAKRTQTWTSRWATSSALLSQAAGLLNSPGQLVGEGATSPLPGNWQVPSQMGMPGHAPLSSPLLHQALPMLKLALIVGMI